MRNRPTTDLSTRPIARLVVIVALLASASVRSSPDPDQGHECTDLSRWHASSSTPGILGWQYHRIEEQSVVRVEDPGSNKFDISLTSPALSVPAQGLEILVTQQMDVSWANTAGVLEISVANGSWTDITAAGGRFLEGAYNLRAYAGNPIGMRAAWAGNLTTFKTRVRLPDQAGNQDIRLRFRLGSGGTGDPHAGWSLREFRCFRD